MKPLLCSIASLILLPQVAHTQPLRKTPIFVAALMRPRTIAPIDTTSLCISFLQSKQTILDRNLITDKEADNLEEFSWDTNKFNFMIPTFCELMGVKTDQDRPETARVPNYYHYPTAKLLREYGKAPIPRLCDVLIEQNSTGKQDVTQRKRNAFDLILLLLDSSEPGQDFFFFRKEAQIYGLYAQRMRILASRVDNTPILSYPIPALDERPDDKRISRACEILIALEAAKTKPLAPADEGALIKELGALHQSISAPTLVEYLAKPIEGVDQEQVKGALLSLGDEAIPEVLRFLRADKRSPASLEEALPLLIALCKTPEAAKARLLQTAQTDEAGAQQFEDKAKIFERDLPKRTP